MFTGYSSFSRKFARGQMFLGMIFVLPVLLAATLWVADAVISWQCRQGLQKACDGAALAGASYLPASPSVAKQVAYNYAAANILNCPAIAGGSSCPGMSNTLDGTGATVTTQISPDDLGMTVSISMPVTLYFAPFLNVITGGSAGGPQLQTQKTARVTSTAGLREAATILNYTIRPIAILQESIQNVGAAVGQTYTLVPGPLNPALAPAGQLVWGAVSFPNELLSDPTTLINDVVSGFSGLATIGEAIYTDTTTSDSLVAQQLQQQILLGAAADPAGTPDQHYLNDPRSITVAIVSVNAGTPAGQVQINGFAQLWLEGTDVNGDITAQFINQVTPAQSADAAQTTLPANIGVYYPVLVN